MVPKRWRTFAILCALGASSLVMEPKHWRVVVAILIANAAATAWGRD